MLKEDFIATQKAGSAKIILKMFFELTLLFLGLQQEKTPEKKCCFQKKKRLKKFPLELPIKKILALPNLLQRRKIT